ncbi:cytochrome P450 [Mycena alexandri]|uniref:Cytochrome P450 n=1 Tax=Mycena alexandri TaxID=1745969 RepID=A0AAD6X8U6_9AGAR|nr:cytochrome P450 [Mycena alexandri]
MAQGFILPVCGLFCLVILSVLYSRRRRRLRLPPGPKKRPIIGNMLDMPSHCQWEVYAGWSREYNIIHLGIPITGTSIIVLSSVQAAQDLLDKRSPIYSDRPRFTMFHDLLAGDRFFGLGKYGDTWRAHRRLFHQAFNGPAGRRFHPHVLKYAHDLLRRLLEEPVAFADHFDHVIAANIISITYGVNIESSNDPCMTATSSGMDAVRSALIPGRFLVDAIPILRYLPAWTPGAGFKRQAAQWKQKVQEMIDLPFDTAKHIFNGGKAYPSFVMDNLRELDEYGQKHAQEEDIKHAAASIYGAGTDTSRFALRVFIRGILENPEAQAKAQQEIDAVVAPGHLPDFADEADLPWVSACLKETLRWWPITPLGLPRIVRGEDVYRGYRIPDGSIVFANAWAMLHNETMYPNPGAFKPERFLREGKLNPAVMDPNIAAFGFGRRICAGKDIAWDILWIMVASILATFDITKAIGENGEVLEPHTGHAEELVDFSFPLPFKCCIKPRSQAAKELIRSTAKF